MSNRLTRVPEDPVPALPALVQLLIPPADLFMRAMISRPVTGSLRTTWVTPATLQLGLLVGVISLALACFAFYRGFNGAGPQSLVGGVLLLCVALGAGSVAIVGTAQRRALGRSG
jgi:hypothetical protein